MSRHHSVSGLARGFNMRRLSNRIAIFGWLGSLLVFIGVAVVGDRLSYSEALTSSFAVLLAWAIGRELDPDRPHVATATMTIAAVLVFFEVPAVLVVFAAMVCLRMVSGTTGAALTRIDLVVVALAGFASGGLLWAWPVGLLIFVWLKSAPEVGRLRWFAVGFLAAGFVAGWYLDHGHLDRVVVTRESLLLAVGAAAFTAVAVAFTSVTARTDNRSGTVQVRRVRLSRSAAGMIAVSAAIVGGVDAFWQVGVLSAATLVSAVASVGGLMRQFSGEQRSEALSP